VKQKSFKYVRPSNKKLILSAISEIMTKNKIKFEEEDIEQLIELNSNDYVILCISQHDSNVELHGVYWHDGEGK